LNDKDSKTIPSPMEETKELHIRYLRAISNPVRREILRILKTQPTTITDLQTKTRIDTKNLKWHLDILEWADCVVKDSTNLEIKYSLTQYGKVVDYVDK